MEYCALMQQADRFVVADTFPFSRQGWHNRTKIRTPDERGWQWLTVPRLHGVGERALHRFLLDSKAEWRREHLRAIELNYRMAPYYEMFVDGLKALINTEYTTLGALTGSTIRWVHEMLGIQSKLIFTSELPGQPGTLEQVWEELGRFEHMVALSDSSEGDARKLPTVSVETLRFDDAPYTQNFPGFVPQLSILDRLFNSGAVL